MRLSEWRDTAPVPTCVSEPVMTVIEGLFDNLGVGLDDPCWVLWGEDTESEAVAVPATATVAGESRELS